jgi:repressor LexA
VPLFENVACGIPIFTDENIEAEVFISIEMIKKGHKYFILRAERDSMDKENQHTENGDRILVLIYDEATVKEYNKNNGMVILKPKSTNKIHQPIILTKDFRVQGIIEKVIPV